MYSCNLNDDVFVLHPPVQAAFTDSEGDERARPSRNNEDVDNEDEDDEDELLVLDPEHVCDLAETLILKAY